LLKLLTDNELVSAELKQSMVCCYVGYADFVRDKLQKRYFACRSKLREKGCEWEGEAAIWGTKRRFC